MKKPSIALSLVPLNPTVGDVGANTNAHIRAAKLTARKGCRVVVFPKMGLFGYPTGNITQWTNVVIGVWAELERFAKETRMLTPIFVVGLPVVIKGRVYCCAAVVHQGQILRLVPQANIPRGDSPYFTPGDLAGRSWFREVPVGNRVVDVDGLKLAIAVGEDAESPAFWDQLDDYDLAVVQQAAWFDSSLGDDRRDNLIARSAEGCAIAAVNQYGANDGLISDGDCLVVCNGTVIAERDLFNRGRLLIVTFDPSTATGLTVPEPPLRRKSIVREMVERRILGLLEYLKRSGAKGFVIAESGGRDSMLATLLAVAALNRYFGHLKPKARRRAVRKAILGVGMPTANNTAVTKALARKFCRELGVPYVEVPIGNVHNANMRLLQKMLGGRGSIARIARQNGQARLRSLLIQTLANCLGFLMLNTCDGAEDLIGYATKGGDALGDLGADEDLGKGQVEEMLRWFYRRSGQRLSAIHRCLTETVPSPELEAGQHAELDNCPYPVVDALRGWFMEDHMTPSQMYVAASLLWTDQELREMDVRYEGRVTLKKWITLVITKFAANVHKLSVAPLCVAVDSATSFDRRFFPFPISQRNVFAADLEEMWKLPE